ncbi:hypothetical protein Y032_0120g889 [Ancylostoma ceylanicum]|uniref:Uncharacterized protein n=1 Tax=Ancylostoma ceylanicum TaxID=53326 RepID=A0A016TAH1_9BILA|nr:hypothetical protein Y032_0120g889 [Ancylostoma ceylanicum]
MDEANKKIPDVKGTMTDRNQCIVIIDMHGSHYHYHSYRLDTIGIVRFIGDDSWEDTREEKNAGKCAIVREKVEKSPLSTWIVNYRRVWNRLYMVENLKKMTISRRKRRWYTK